MESPLSRNFNPYADNGGTILAIAGDEFCIAAGDTRQSDGYSIHTRYAPKVFELRDNIVLCASGFQADILTLKMLLERRMEIYYNTHEKHMSPNSFAQMLSIVLYGRRFFPYFTWNIVGTLDEKGRGVVYKYDPVGSYEPLEWSCAGSGSDLIQPFLDNQLSKAHQKVEKKKITLENALNIAKDAFYSAAESDIYTGDTVEVFIMTRDGVSKQKFPLRED